MLQDHIKHISASRLQPYLDKFYLGNPNHLADAVVIYTAVQHRSAIFFSLIQEIEVATRNAMADCLRRTVPNNNLKDYFDFIAYDTNSPLSPKGKKQLQLSLKISKKTVTENDIIANITFGFWVNLLNLQDKTIRTAFRQLFPNAFPNFKTMYLELKQVQTFRNDLYHQEKAWDKKRVKKPEHILKDYQTRYNQFEKLLSKIAPERLDLRNKASLNAHFSQLNFDLTLFKSELNWLLQHI